MGSPIDPSDAFDASDVAEAKRELRRSMRAIRRDVDDPTGRSARLWARLQAMPAVIDAEVVMAFESVAGEPQTAPFIEWCRRAGKDVLVPAADPAAEFPPRVDRVDVVVVPGLAFTADGDRLGQGGGWYDRLLAAVRPACISIGVCFAEQLVGTVPVEPHDQRLDHVVTDASPSRAPTSGGGVPPTPSARNQ